MRSSTALFVCIGITLLTNGCSLHAVRPYERSQLVKLDRAQLRDEVPAAQRNRHRDLQEAARDARQDDIAGRR
jgi:hypothetical protein